MALVKPSVFNGQLQRQAQPGDAISGTEVRSTLSTAGAGTITAAQITNGILVRTGPSAGFVDTTATAAEIISQLLANQQYLGGGAQTPQGIDRGLTLRLRYLNTVAYAATLAAGTGVDLMGNTGVNSLSVKEFLLTIKNGTPQQVLAGNTTSASTSVGGLTAAQLQNLTPGMLVSGTGIPGGASVASQNLNGNLVLSTAATATGSAVALTFNPNVELLGLGQGTL